MRKNAVLGKFAGMLLPRLIASAIDKVAGKTLGKDWGLYAALLGHWPEIVGATYARDTTPVKIAFPQGKIAAEKGSRRTGGVLHIRLPQGLAMEFSFLTGQILQRVNAYFGREVINRIVFEPYYAAPDAADVTAEPSNAPSSPPPPAVDKDLIEDDELRESVQGLGEAIFNTRRRVQD